jgi:hypothetical protein
VCQGNTKSVLYANLAASTFSPVPPATKLPYESKMIEWIHFACAFGATQAYGWDGTLQVRIFLVIIVPIKAVGPAPNTQAAICSAYRVRAIGLCAEM